VGAGRATALAKRIAKRVAVLLAVSLLTILAVRAWDSRRGPPLEPWHELVPEELHADDLDRADWAAYLAAEDATFAALQAELAERLDAEDRVPLNRYFAGSPIHPGGFAHDWNRSFVLEPEATPVGVAVFLHGLTDSPFSARRILERYRARGFVGIAIRLPAHGTVPGALTDVVWEDWAAATRLAVREARRRVGPERPLHVIGYSNGGALAMQYALDALENESLARPDRVVLISPMIGVTRFARFAGLAGLPALLPAFAKAAWLDLVPEFNPFKYNSFPVNAARQSFLLSDGLQRQIARLAAEGRLADLPPVLTFQSVIDFTVSTRAIVDALYAHLPANGSELVLYDMNRNGAFSLLLRARAEAQLGRLLPPAPRRYRTTIVANAGPEASAVAERVVEAGATEERTRDLPLAFPDGVFSLSHIALPFAMDDGLYGLEPDPAEDFGIRLGSVGVRGERGALVMGLDSLMRLSSNPFFAYQMERIEEAITAPGGLAGR
jgi:alpha-beta hydrolase superfamily lysophospholipase